MSRFLGVVFTVLALSILSTFVTTAIGYDGEKGVVPDAGFVPDEVTAIRIAEAVLIPIYGQKKVGSERPFSAKLTKGVWKVEGYLPEGASGGVAEVRIDKRDGRILHVIHGK